MKKTRLMSKLFSDATPEEYKEKILDKIDEAHDNGSASLEEDDEVLQFADVDGDIIVEDQTDGMNEVTRISQNPEDENDLVMSAVDIPTEDPEEETPEDAEGSIEIKNESEDDPDAEDETIIDVQNEEGTTNYSLKFKKFSSRDARLYAKIFSEMTEILKDAPKDVADEDVEVKVKDGEVKVMSVRFGTPTRFFSEDGDEDTTEITEVIDAANELSEKAEGGITKDNASEIQELAADIISKTEELEGDSKEFSLKCIKSMAKMFSEEAAEVADAADGTQEEIRTYPPIEAFKNQYDNKIAQGYQYVIAKESSLSSPDFGKAWVKKLTPDVFRDYTIKGFYKTKDEADKALESKSFSDGSEELETPGEEGTKTESNANPTIKQCPETGKWFIEEDPEKKLYDTQEEAEQVAAREFCDKKFSDTDPKVTVTVENLEPASLAELLGGGKEEKEPEEDVTPKVDPNQEQFGRSFSLKGGNKDAYENPLLRTEIN